ncbi:MAG: hypothetical protein NTZ26_09370 [Candidatus Aminicenantes bacterium]|nr:hypothetical protein [Candidatus Aminicenantes bacterium]
MPKKKARFSIITGAVLVTLAGAMPLSSLNEKVPTPGPRDEIRSDIVSRTARRRLGTTEKQSLSPAKAPQPLAPERIKELQAADRDIMGDQILARKVDPSFEILAGLMPGMKKSREAVGVKHHLHDIGVAPDGTLELSDDVDVAGSPVAFFEMGTPFVRFGAAPAGCSKSLLKGFLPVVQVRFDSGGISYIETVFGYSEGLSPDADLWAYVELDARNAGAQTVNTKVRFRFEPAFAANPPREWTLSLAAGASHKIRLKIPWAVRTVKYQEPTAPDYARAYGQVVDFWSKDLASGLQINVPEPRVNDAYRAWLAYASLDVDKRNDVLEPHDGAGFYEEVFGYSAALYPHALDLWGRPDEARAVLDSLLTFQAPDGLFTSHFGTPDPGTLLFALWEHYEMTRDAAWLRRVAPNMIRMADWIIRKRRESIPPAGAPKAVTYGLIKFSPYCDFQTPSFDYFGDTYCAVGLEKTAKALAAAGLKAESDRIAKEAAAYRADILASMDAAVIVRDGRKILPVEPDTHRLLKSTNYRGGGYYGLIASCMLESEFLPAADPRAAMVMRFMEEKGGLRLGMSEFDGGVDHAYTYGYWLDCLKLGNVKPVLLGFYGSLAYGMSRQTYSGVEVTHLFTGANEPTLPHLYSCTEQLRLLRMMLLRDEGDELQILPAVPRDWLDAGKTIEIKNAPTRFGAVSYSVDSQIDKKKIVVTLSVPARLAPKKIVLRLRHPHGEAIKGVTVDGKPISTFKGETLEIAAPSGAMKIEVLF